MNEFNSKSSFINTSVKGGSYWDLHIW